MSKRHYRPQRTCLGCGARDQQARMIRITAPQANALNIGRHSHGRGGYLHAAEACWQGFIKRKSTYRAFHIEVSKAAREDLVRSLRELKA